MPRLPPALIRQATSQNPLLPLLLRVCRDLPSARNELRWLEEHARSLVNTQTFASHKAVDSHGLPRLDPSEETGSVDWQTVKLDTKIEDCHGPLNQTQQGVPITKAIDGRGSRKVAAVPTGSIISSSTAQAQSVRIRKHDVGGTAHITAEQRKLTVRKVKVQTDRTRIRTYSVGEVSTLKAEGAGPSIRQVRTRNDQSIVHAPTPAKIRSWHDEGVREPGLWPPSSEDLIRSETAEHAQVKKILAQNVGKRSKGMPLQYIIGNQPFGNLDILCQPRVLIPRPETETYTEKVGNLLLSALSSTYPSTGSGPQSRKKFRILDLCTGTGCIALLLHSILKPPGHVSGNDSAAISPNMSIEILGIDNSPDAVSLAQKNLAHNISQKLLHPDAVIDVSFRNVDVLGLAKRAGDGEDTQHQIRKVLNGAAGDVGEQSKEEDSSSPTAPWDVIIANPPYIGPKDYEPGGRTEPSVRNYEPKEALVPTFARGEDWYRYRSSSIVLADLFYWPLVRIARAVDAKLLLMEVGDSEQASRVCKQVLRHYSSPTARRQLTPRLETWRDDGSVRIVPTRPSPSFDADFEEATDPTVADRAVVVWTNQMADWRRDTLPTSNPELDRTPT
ncbi:Methyltransferase domain-containing protein [Cladophialophora immunda]|nr:Methyltransferase domain-containing protein [Cladophialophora immunda]